MPRVRWSGFPRALISCVVVAVTLSLAAARTARAQTATTTAISMAAAPAAPRIQGPPVVATLPGAPVVHTLAATGTPRPTSAPWGCPRGFYRNRLLALAVRCRRRK